MNDTPWQSEVHWRREGQQDRAHKTQNRVLDAAEILFFEQGYDATSVQHVAKQAQCSIGSVYHHFKDKKAIAFALFDRMTREFELTMREVMEPARWEGAGIADILREFIEFAILNNKARPGFKSAALEAVRLDPSLGDHFPQMQRKANKQLKALLLARRQEVGHPDPAYACGYVLDLLIALMRARFDPHVQKSQLSRLSNAKFTEQALSLACAFLQLDKQETANHV
ncbi:TetR/AcrR family transcriptional regulator [Alterisphingorhabdus coralli]|uniref:TetR/AcrR family transcriptional regulator n=1 Tax=Alterisphingorhabdus coralli TaxID=3071408 RepID=A0AA97F7U8_9SPHN|nr:TetR/AcrR family transcriptional regulator [Parasphingorhabdus sp. SCSIO 66989]WOE75081.1 TetR/AcrR family transcriptional regulator [Parasphingorhabdus sp. SCSIO 66989]